MKSVEVIRPEIKNNFITSNNPFSFFKDTGQFFNQVPMNNVDVIRKVKKKIK
jgi:hypothetical protein